ncbi:hypothetical protein GCM10011505_34410 [Tistrella bauzanensis]|uniref:Uncharacterized protein n=1 Tax=Tistrella bauzanensis TaxID=657419 RepID=A0ABQ1IR92_9PROT|nr:hypothetical protein GCM10011505_34410 [Tistrella bauzanensis]
MGDRQAAEGEVGIERLDVAQAGTAGRCVTDMADAHIADHLHHQALIGKGVANQADRAMRMELVAIISDDATGFLAAMLKRMQPERHVTCRFLMAMDTEDSALFAQMVVVF